MAVRFDANTDSLYRLTGILDYNGPYAVMAWVRAEATATFFGYIFAIHDQSINNEDMVGNWDTTLQLRVNTRISGVSDNNLGSTLSSDIWYHLAMVRESTTVLKLYINGELDVTSTADCTSRAASSKIQYGEHENLGNGFNGRIAAIKEYSASLSQDEIRCEMSQLLPVRLANLNAWYPCFPGATERLADYSGNGHSFTATGTLTDEDGPPVPWQVEVSQTWFVGAENYIRIIAEIETISEATLRSLILNRFITETEGVSELVTRFKTMSRFIAETVVILETISRVRTLTRTISETLAISELVNRVTGLTRLISEALSISEVTFQILGAFTQLKATFKGMFKGMFKGIQ